MHQVWPLVLETDQTVGNLAEAINEIWSGQIAVVNRLSDPLPLQLCLSFTPHLAYFVARALQDIVLTESLSFLIRHVVLEWRQEDILRCYLIHFVVFFQALDFVVRELP